VGLAGFLMIYLRRSSLNHLGLTWKRFLLAVAVLWVVSICYFLTKKVTGPHYMISPIFATLTLIGFGALEIEIHDEKVRCFDRRQALSWMALLLVLWPGVATIKDVWTNRFFESRA
jgi:hypothetical protein